MNRNNNFDLIRLFAALQVVVGHCAHHLELNLFIYDYFLRFFPGVPIFFLISGYLISAAYQRSENLKGYLFNRFVRIYPGLWVCFLVTLIFVFFASNSEVPAISFAKWVVAQITIGQFYNPEFLRGYGVGAINGSLWTIPVELQFYLITPILFFFMRKVTANKFSYVIIVLMILFLCVNYGYGEYLSKKNSPSIFDKLFGVTFMPFVYYFILGAIFQEYKNKVIHLLSGKFFIILAAYLILAYCFDFLGYITYGSFLNFILVFMLALLVMCAAYTNPNLSSRLLRGNDISYGIYIYHMLWVNYLIGFDIDSAYKFFIVMFLTIISGYMSWRFIERPVLSLK